jgi:ferric-dicitrate binding protein FerR (iron transport regulator)
MENQREADDLIFSYFFGEIGREELARLEEILSSSEEARDRFAELAEQEVALQQALFTRGTVVREKKQRDMVSLPKVRRQGYARIQRKVKAYRRRMWLSVAACLAIAAGSVYYHLYHRPDALPARSSVARVVAASHRVGVERGGETVVCTAREGILPGDVIRTAAGQTVTFAYEGEETRVTVGENAVLSVGGIAQGKRIEVRSGRVEIAAAAQPEGTPLIVMTPHSEARVLGTVFSLLVDSVSTKLDVSEGLVGFTDLASGRYLEVTAGSSAMAGTSDIKVAAREPAEKPPAEPSRPVFLGHWKLDERKGFLAGDSSGCENHAMLRGRTKWVTGKRGGGLRFDGQADYVAITNMHYARKGAVDALTVAFWVATIRQGQSAIVDFDRSEYWSVGVKFMDTQGDGRLSWDTTSSAGVIDDMESRARINTGNWRHVCVVYDSKEKKDKKIYIDGVLDKAKDAYGKGTRLGTGETRYGFLGDGSEAKTFDGERNERYFKGMLDDVRVYHRALTEEEIRALAAPRGGKVVGEAGSLSVEQDHGNQWHTVRLSRRYADPVVVMGPLTSNGAHPAMIRVRRASAGSFEFQIDEWKCTEANHTEERVSFLVLDAGRYVLDDGRLIEAGRTKVDHDWRRVSFVSGFLSAPVVVSQCMSLRSTDPVVTRHQEVGPGGFQVRLQEEEAAANGGNHCTETVGWIALETGSGTSRGRRLEAIRTSASVTEQPYSISFARAFGGRIPALLASIQTFEGDNTAGLRWESITPRAARIFINEETSADEEIKHAPEVVGCIALEAGPVLAFEAVVRDLPFGAPDGGAAVASAPVSGRDEAKD